MIEYSPLKNLPSPIYKSIAHSPKVHLKKQIEVKRSIDKKLKKVEQCFAQGKTLKNIDD